MPSRNPFKQSARIVIAGEEFSLTCGDALWAGPAGASLDRLNRELVPDFRPEYGDFFATSVRAAAAQAGGTVLELVEAPELNVPDDELATA
jgi:hypothetical protein